MENYKCSAQNCWCGNREMEVTATIRNSTDDLMMKVEFNSEEEYYSTLFHELAHSTGHDSRLARDIGHSQFGSATYSKEELVAEMSSAMLCGIAGIENRTIDNSAAYIQSWLKVLKSDKKLLVSAGGQAQKACDMIAGNQE